MSEKELIEVAYQDTVKRAFGILYDAVITAENGAMTAQAEKRFQEAIRIGRIVRDRAIALVP